MLNSRGTLVLLFGFFKCVSGDIFGGLDGFSVVLNVEVNGDLNNKNLKKVYNKLIAQIVEDKALYENENFNFELTFGSADTENLTNEEIEAAAVDSELTDSNDEEQVIENGVENNTENADAISGEETEEETPEDKETETSPESEQESVSVDRRLNAAVSEVDLELTFECNSPWWDHWSCPYYCDEYVNASPKAWTRWLYSAELEKSVVQVHSVNGHCPILFWPTFYCWTFWTLILCCCCGCLCACVSSCGSGGSSKSYSSRKSYTSSSSSSSD